MTSSIAASCRTSWISDETGEVLLHLAEHERPTADLVFCGVVGQIVLRHLLVDVLRDDVAPEGGRRGSGTDEVSSRVLASMTFAVRFA
jgi:hypothetical protein